MYCSKCKKQSPDNFTICAYCGAKLKADAPKKHIIYKTDAKRIHLPGLKSFTATLIAVAVIIALISGIVGIATGGKPESVLKLLSSSIEEKNSEKYSELYDEFYKEYEKEYRYYSDDELNAALCEPLFESVRFYEKTCGEDFKIKYRQDSIRYITGEELDAINETLLNDYGYYKTCTKAAVIDFSLEVKGSLGEYTTVYKNFYCIKLSGKWYKAPEL